LVSGETEMGSRIEHVKGVVLVRYGDGTEKILPKNTYLRMKNAGRKIVLLKEGQHWYELR
jgi:hypothetical protein